MSIFFFCWHFLGKGHYYEFHNVKIQKERQKKFKASEHRKYLFSFSLLQNQNVEKNIKIKTFDVLILPMDSKKIRTSKIENINYVWRITYGYQGLWGVRLGSIRLG